MNLTGVPPVSTVPPAVPPAPAVPHVQPAAQSSATGNGRGEEAALAEHRKSAAKHGAAQERTTQAQQVAAAAHEAALEAAKRMPPMTPLTTAEVRSILGGNPAEHAKVAKAPVAAPVKPPPGDGREFDQYT